MPEASSDYYFDTVTLSNFALARRLDLLIARYGRKGRIANEVLSEVLDGIAAGYSALREIEAAVTTGRLRSSKPLSSAERETYGELLRVLAPGEAACIALASARGGIVVSDDRAARQCCAERGIEVTGTIGILKACCLDGTIAVDEADTVLEAMIDAGFHSPVERISSIM